MTDPSFEQGLDRMHELYGSISQAAPAAALRHAEVAERAAATVPDLRPDTPCRPVRRVAVVGGGTMGTGIAMCFLDAGFPVTLLEKDAAALERGTATIRSYYERQVKRGKLEVSACDERLSRLVATTSYADLGDSDLAIEAVFEELSVKQRVFRSLDQSMKPGAIIATNTSTLNVDTIAAFTGRPQDVVGMHFFSPANLMKLLEVVRGRATAQDVLATVMRLAGRIGKIGVVSGVCDGFIGNRMADQYIRQSHFLLEEGCTVEQVDRAMERFGIALGPFRMLDLAGNDIGHAIRQRRAVEQPQIRYSRIADRIFEAGRLGQKSGAGYYDYAAGSREAVVSPVVTRIVEEYRAEAGIAARAISDDEIVRRHVWALVNEGARILEEGIASRAGDIDVIYMTGYGFPRQRGGPMFHADATGLDEVVKWMRRFSGNPRADSEFWQPAPLLLRLAAERSTFGALDAASAAHVDPR